MIRITFKDVGQGDSVIIEWKKEKENKIAIIDCKKAYKTNPVLDYIKEKKVQEISFILLTHPHLDHCSGLAELIEYCISNKIKINYFLHTSNNMPNFWKAAIEGDEAQFEIIRLFNVIIKAEKIGMMRHPIQANLIFNDITLDDEYSIKLIAPTSEHLNNYAKNFAEPPFEEEAGNKPCANWLATLIKIYSNKHDGYILLTSDSNKEVMYYKETDPLNFNGKLILAQCPHHGAEGNFKNAFWKLIRREDKTPIVISVGENIYGHPAEKVITDFNKNNYKLFSTNEIGALASIKHTDKGKEASIHLSTFGEVVATSKIDNLNGDKVFEIDSTGKVLAK